MSLLSVAQKITFYHQYAEDPGVVVCNVKKGSSMRGGRSLEWGLHFFFPSSEKRMVGLPLWGVLPPVLWLFSPPGLSKMAVCSHITNAPGFTGENFLGSSLAKGQFNKFRSTKIKDFLAGVNLM